MLPCDGRRIDAHPMEGGRVTLLSRGSPAIRRPETSRPKPKKIEAQPPKASNQLVTV